MDVMNHLLAKKYEKEELSIQHKIEIEDAEALIKYYDHDEDKVLDSAEFAKILMEKDISKDNMHSKKFSNKS